MARGPSARVVLNRSKFPPIYVAVADGMFEVAKKMIEEANPPDATPFGEGLVTRGGALAYVGDKKVAGWSTRGQQPKKPRAFRVRGSGRIMAMAGFGFPARFQEFGTIKQSPRPFFTPAINRVIPRITRIMAPIVRAHLERMR
jgi:HK97 gp10 family phage protein